MGVIKNDPLVTVVANSCGAAVLGCVCVCICVCVYVCVYYHPSDVVQGSSSGEHPRTSGGPVDGWDHTAP